MTSTTVLQLLVLLMACLCATSRAQNIANKMIMLGDTQSICSRNMACRLAFCPWERNPTVTVDKCTFLESCTCPPNTLCAISNVVIPGNLYNTYKFKCRSHSELFQSAMTTH